MKIGRIVKDFLVFGFAAYGIFWTAIESVGAFFENVRPEGVLGYVPLVLISIVVGLWRSWPRCHVEIPIPVSNSSIHITFGDIFEGEGVVVIPVNEYFDAELGDHVSTSSLHGQFINRVLDGQSSSFIDLTSNALSAVEPCEVQRGGGRIFKYPIGTVACVDVTSRRFLLAALSRTNTQTLKACATMRDYWDCLGGVWKGVRDHSNGASVRVPLLGSGLSGVGLPPRFLIDMIATSFIYYTKQREVAQSVTLVLPDRLKGEIDLVEIRRRLKLGL